MFADQLPILGHRKSRNHANFDQKNKRLEANAGESLA